jgi:hypothetical protein
MWGGVGREGQRVMHMSYAKDTTRTNGDGIAGTKKKGGKHNQHGAVATHTHTHRVSCLEDTRPRRKAPPIFNLLTESPPFWW